MILYCYVDARYGNLLCYRLVIIYCIFPRILVYYFHQSLMQETHTMTCHFLNFDKVTSGLLANHLTYERMLTNKSELLYRGSPFLPDSHSPCGPVDHYR